MNENYDNRYFFCYHDALRDYIWWKQQVGNTDFLTWLFYPLYGLVTMSTWKVPKRIFFFGLKRGFQSGFFRFGQKFSNLTKFLCAPKNHYFEHFGGRQRLSGLKTLPKQVLKVKKPRKIEMAALAGPNCTEPTLGQKIGATDPFVYFFCPNHGRQIFVVQKPNLSIFGLLEVLLNNKRAFGLVGQPKQPSHKKFRPRKLQCRFLKAFI